MNTKIRYKRKGLSDELLKELYRGMLEPRMIEEKMLKRLRQGKLSKWFSGIGQEAIAVGSTRALNDNDLIFPMHRNLGVFTQRNIPLERLFCQWQGKAMGFSKGRERSFHFGTLEYHIVGMISHLGPQLSLACGAGLAYKLKKEKRMAIAFTGEGGTSEGDFHEALNVAAVWDLPVIFLIENNGYGLSTPINEQYKCENLVDRAKGYGMEGIQIDGNNIIEVYTTIQKLADEIREHPRPVLLECMTFRIRGHEEASGTKYVPKKLMDTWAEKDPVENYEQFLLAEGILDDNRIAEIREEIRKNIETALDYADQQPAVEPDIAREVGDVFISNEKTGIQAVPDTDREVRFVDAIKEGLDQAMKKHDNLVLMGQDIAEYGGVFKATEGLHKKYGAERVRNTPLCESAIIGTALGLSLEGFKSMVEMQFADFVTCGFNQIVNNLAKIHYRWDARADVVIRMPTGAGVGAGPFHSQSNEAWFFHVPGLKIVYPSNATDAKGLLLAAFEDPNPVLYFEHKALYRNNSSLVPEDYFLTPIGKASFIRKGHQASIITYGAGVHWAVEVVDRMGVDVDILDLRTLMPLDFEAIEESVTRTNRVMLLHEDTLTGGIGAEISALISEKCFQELDAPLIRVAGLDTPVPFAGPLEQQFLPKGRIEEKLKYLIDY